MDLDQFVRGDSANLPKMDNIMILEFMKSDDKHNIAEIRGAKALMSSRAAYIDTAVGYVEIKRTRTECTARAKIVPEHRVSVKQYTVTVKIDESTERITETSCDDCAASAGGCKHTLVFLFWLEKKSSQPASTSVECYWKKPRLAGVKNDPVSSQNVFETEKQIKISAKDPRVFENFLEECKNQNVSKSLAVCFHETKASYNIFDMTVKFLKDHNENFDHYIKFLDQMITPEVKSTINEKTRTQVDSKLWHDIRQGRITASKIYEASRCKTEDGSLVQQILGGYKVPETVAIKRGKALEKMVIEESAKKIKKTIAPCGFMLINGIVGASPDGVGDEFVVEVKCPATERAIKAYVENGVVKQKYFAQLQLQMLAAEKQEGIFCVAAPKFEETKEVSIYRIKYDEEYTKELIKQAELFWKSYIYKKIVLTART